MEVVHVFAKKEKLITLAAAGTLALSAAQAAGPAQATSGETHASHSSSVGILERPERAMRRTISVAHERLAKARARKHSASAQSAAGAPASPESYGVSQSTLDAIAACESGGDPSAVSAGGIYRGLYQFDQATWESVGGTGDPAAASPAEQSMRAAILYSQSGSSPWPVCG
jgi:soluble lytic murein transglycosylase-like protein